MNISLPSDKMSVDEAIDWLDRNAPDETSTMGEAIYTILNEIGSLRDLVKVQKECIEVQAESIHLQDVKIFDKNRELERVKAEYMHYMKTH